MTVITLKFPKNLENDYPTRNPIKNKVMFMLLKNSANSLSFRIFRKVGADDIVILLTCHQSPKLQTMEMMEISFALCIPLHTFAHQHVLPPSANSDEHRLLVLRVRQ